MNRNLTLSVSPHIHSGKTTSRIMLDVLIALSPATVAGVVIFGLRALLVLAITVASCVGFEALYNFLLKKEQTVGDFSAAVTGLLLGLNLPANIPLWQCVIGSLFAIIVVKMLFGGVGRNIVNPALAGRAFMMSWAVLMSTWVKVGFGNAPILGDTSLEALDGMTAATPMSFMHQGVMPQGVSVMDMFLGNIGGCLGETSALLLLIGFAYLLIRKIVSLRIPVAFVGTVAVLTFLFPQGNDRVAWMAYQLCGGGLMLGAMFMATDYVTSPVTHLGQVVYGIGCGLLTVIIRYFGGYPEGVSYAILIMNCCVVLLDRIGRPKKFGAPKKVKKGVAKV